MKRGDGIVDVFLGKPKNGDMKDLVVDGGASLGGQDRYGNKVKKLMRDIICGTPPVHKASTGEAPNLWIWLSHSVSGGCADPATP